MSRQLRVESGMIFLAGATAIKAIEADIQTRKVVLPLLLATIDLECMG
jgi:hypothetical protein